ncbi:Hypothetical predicted protein [Olea europaea subsp. europaea]|uniref:Uncharacterized protein n=1 Tax=Olea europaea subsp. europaea TaxID=158383 RepID=A0A8S0VEC8_OLEEU|nr:Hypothetical predicted protein [Olea europaea subsp. europaea]
MNVATSFLLEYPSPATPMVAHHQHSIALIQISGDWHQSSINHVPATMGNTSISSIDAEIVAGMGVFGRSFHSRLASFEQKFWHVRSELGPAIGLGL